MAGRRRRGAFDPCSFSRRAADETGMNQQFSDSQAAKVLLSRREALGGGLLLTMAALSGCNAGRKIAVPSAMAGASTSPVLPYIPGPLPATPAPTVITPAPGIGRGSVSVIPRSAWASRGPIRDQNHKLNDMGRVSRITIHHEGDDPFTYTAQMEVAKRLERIRQYHTSKTKKGSNEKWADIGYHYIIDPAGRVWEGRNTAFQGCTCRTRTRTTSA